MEVNIIFYDITSTYFEVRDCNISRFGYSRDRRPDKKQILIGLVVTKQGLQNRIGRDEVFSLL